jgi:hypothetical protein
MRIPGMTTARHQHQIVAGREGSQTLAWVWLAVQ